MEITHMTIEVQAYWLRYHGLTVDLAPAFYRIENAAWKTVPRVQDDAPEIAGLMIAI